MFRTGIRRGVWVALAAAVVLCLAGATWRGYVAARSARLNAALIRAIQQGDAPAVRSLLDRGADPNAVWDRSGFRVRAGRDSVRKLLPVLLPGGPEDPNARVTVLGVAAACGAVQGRTDIVRLLLDRGARVDERFGYAETALSLGVAWKNPSEAGNLATARALLDGGADVNAVASGGATALIRAASGGRGATAKFLLDRGADINARDGFGRTALRAAREAGHADVAALLEKSGARE